MDFADCTQKKLIKLVQMSFSPTSLAVMICNHVGGIICHISFSPAKAADDSLITISKLEFQRKTRVLRKRTQRLLRKKTLCKVYLSFGLDLLRKIIIFLMYSHTKIRYLF